MEMVKKAKTNYAHEHAAINHDYRVSVNRAKNKMHEEALKNTIRLMNIFATILADTHITSAETPKKRVYDMGVCEHAHHDHVKLPVLEASMIEILPSAMHAYDSSLGGVKLGSTVSFAHLTMLRYLSCGKCSSLNSDHSSQAPMSLNFRDSNAGKTLETGWESSRRW
ncbi:hypothetical protein OsJ_23819 [Oryza sativa Japonica Group]|uniref:Uncharacterized protein n=1 Tax=Oryza sativa subsp. japonica TaxID=39947 RepID=B9FWL3_ORYSJ|nr:hypothetical protein OsJ_23819 [Oryza sativa Japonica Group]